MTSTLTTLRRIQQDVDSAPDLFHLLQTVVKSVRTALNAAYSNIFLFDAEQQRYVLAATAGLNADLVNKLTIPDGKGLVSLITKRAEPLNLDNAQKHPQFYAELVLGENNYYGFLGAPIVHRKQILGVITAQKTVAEVFDAEEEAFLLTLCAQLAGTIAQAKSSGYFGALINNQIRDKKNDNILLTGLPCVTGIAIGQATVIYPQADLDAVPYQVTEDIDKELILFEQGLLACRKEISNLRQRLAATLPAQELLLFDAYLSMLDDNSLGNEIRETINKGLTAESALHEVIIQHEQHFAVMDDEYLRERSTDIRSLGQRLLACLQEHQDTNYVYPEKTILVGDEISAADLAEVPEGRLAGIVSSRGSINSHIAILARALSVPAILGVEGLPIAQLDKKELILNGNSGEIYVSPSPELIKKYREQQQKDQQTKADLLYLRDLPAETLDGHRLSLRVNIGLTINRGSSLTMNAEGVGLFRSEVTFFGRDRFPTETEQQVIYRQLLTAFAPRPVIMRTLDVGGDKALSYFGIQEENPALGWRGIRVTLDHPEVFLVQIRAMLRASEGLDNLQIMLPMVSMLSEIEEAKVLIHRAYQELCEEGLKIKLPLIGAMLEVPAAIYQTRQFAEAVDFLSIGSNDLIQYLLAVDRNNAYVAHLYQSLHPAVLRALYYAVKETKSAGKWISICGEMAANTLAVPLLLGMGFDCLSTHSANLLQVKAIVRSITRKEAESVLQEALLLSNAEQVTALVKQHFLPPA